MDISDFRFILTEECNYSCSYCYQTRAAKTIDISTVERALDFFFPYLSEKCLIAFTGGEPLLEFAQIRHAVEYTKHKNKTFNRKIRFNITTNGSLIDDDILEFLNQNEFSVWLSFDGDAQDISRKKQSHKQIVTVMEKLLESPNIDFVTNSVFTPETVGHLSKSIRFLMELGVPDIHLALNKISPWNASSLQQLREELLSVSEFILPFYERTKTFPLSFFRRDSEKSVFSCAAGEDRMALAPDGKLWGCYLFPELFNGREENPESNKYCFGELGTFIKNYEKIYTEVRENYSKLHMDNFYTDNCSCHECSDLLECSACPVDAALSSSILGKIPTWTCEIKKIFRKQRKLFWKELDSISRG
jgi:sulfatase maturation enzyme AslB (radical SAM superfamily)